MLWDGSLRFLALAALALDSEYHGRLALEESENGIHPERIPAILGLLQDVAVNPARESGPDNLLRHAFLHPLVTRGASRSRGETRRVARATSSSNS